MKEKKKECLSNFIQCITPNYPLILKARSKSFGSLPKFAISFRRRKKPVVFSNETSLTPVYYGKSPNNGPGTIRISRIFEGENANEHLSENNNLPDGKVDSSATKVER